MAEFSVGIDLGTTSCCISVHRYGRAEVIPNDIGGNTTPSFIFFHDGDRYHGTRAKENAFANPGAAIFGVKRIIGKKFNDRQVQEYARKCTFPITEKDGFPVIEVMDGGRLVKYSPSDISGFLLKELKKYADSFLGTDLRKVVITVPANFTDAQRKATKEAGEKAGLKVIGMIHEPTAAALAYGLQEITIDQTILVFDFGRETLDVAILKIAGGERFEVLASAGDMNLGGEDMDELLLDHFIKEYREQTGTDLRQNAQVIYRLRERVEKVKINLSRGDGPTRIALDCVDGSKSLNSKITRTVFEDLCKDIFARILSLVEKALTQASLTKDDIDKVVLIGGSSQIPKVREILQNYFPGKLLKMDIRPDEAIAKGAATYAHLIQGDAELENIGLRIIDIIPHSLGLEVKNGQMKVLIGKGAQIPISKTVTCTTTTHTRTSFELLVYEGESSLARNNHFLGQLSLSGITPTSGGFPIIKVTYSYDELGCVSIQALDEQSGNVVRADFNCSANHA